MQMKTRIWDRGGKGALTFSELGFGSAPIGNLYRAITEVEAQEVLETAWTCGVRHFDTAPLYGLGLSETRLNSFLRDKPRGDYTLATKIGRILRSARPGEPRTALGKFFDVPARVEVYDYSYDGVMRSLEFSLERLGQDRVDILHAHDLDIFTHGSAAARDQRLAEFMAGGYKALLSLRDQGVIRAFGAGLNEWQSCQWLTERGDFDLFLLAGRYTLLEQEALASFLPLAQSRGIGIILGGAYNSGVLASTAAERAQGKAFYNYDPAPPAVLERVAQIEAVCSAHGVRMIDAAFQFPLRHPAVLSVIAGAQSAAQVRQSALAAAQLIPAGLWAALKAKGLIRRDAPVG
jgi:D-threo-aldose 1-dehydrogenase